MGRYASPLVLSESKMPATNLRTSKKLAAILEDLEDASDELENLDDTGGDTQGS